MTDDEIQPAGREVGAGAAGEVSKHVYSFPTGAA